MTSIIVSALKTIIEGNFLVSVMVLVVVSIFCISPTHSYFDMNEELFGAMANNLRLTMLYLGVTEVLICAYCFASKRTQFFIPVGFFLILMMGSMQFYDVINDVNIDENFQVSSHIPGSRTLHLAPWQKSRNIKISPAIIFKTPETRQ